MKLHILISHTCIIWNPLSYKNNAGSAYLDLNKSIKSFSKINIFNAQRKQNLTAKN